MSMKVSQIGTSQYNAPGILGTGEQGEAENRPLVFSKTLSTLGAQQLQSHLTELVDRIEKQGQRLGERADVGELTKYRELVRSFMDEVVSNSYSFTKENTFAHRGRHRIIATVSVVNQKLDKLAEQVLSGQAEQIELLNQVDDIRGLLLDMLL